LEGYYDGNIGKMVGLVEKTGEWIYEPSILINNSIISVNEKEYIEYTNSGKLTEFKCGNGVLLNVSYRMSIIDYNIENEARKEKDNTNHYLAPLGKAIDDYELALSNLEECCLNENYVAQNDNDSATDSSKELAKEIAEARLAVRDTYTTYIIELVAAQEEDARRKGEIA
jgi:hypothetical protein